MPFGATTLVKKSGGRRGESASSGEPRKRRPRKTSVDRDELAAAIRSLQQRVTRLRAIEKKMAVSGVESVEFQGAAWLNDALKLIDGWRNRARFQLDEQTGEDTELL